MGGTLSAPRLAGRKKKQRTSNVAVPSKQNEETLSSVQPIEDVKGTKPQTENGILTDGSTLRHRLVTTDMSHAGSGTGHEDSTSSTQERALIDLCTPDESLKEPFVSTDLEAEGAVETPTSGNDASRVADSQSTPEEEREVTMASKCDALEGSDVQASPLDGDGDGEVVREEAESDTANEQKDAQVQGDESKQWSFPPVLDDFNLMDTDVDPCELEETFADNRLVEVKLCMDQQECGLGISIVGGTGSPTGDLPIVIKRILPQGLAAKDGRLKAGDQLIAVNELLLIGVSKTYALNALSNLQGNVRLLVLQDY